MSNETIVARRRKTDGKLVRVFPDGHEEPFPDDDTDWDALRAMSDDEINAAARTDPDNPPSQDYPPGRLKRLPQVRQMRRALHLTQDEFSARFGIPLGTLRDWEQGKSEPDQAARSYLRVIAAEPEAVAKALRKRTAAV